LLELTLDSHIRIKNLSSQWREGLTELCSVENESKEIALREEVWGAVNMADKLTLVDNSNDEICLPRGFYNELVKLLQEVDIEFKVNDQTSWDNANPIGQPNNFPKLRPEQKSAMMAMINNLEGRIIMPPGKGKTIIGLSALSAFPGPVIIIVDKKHIGQQWIDRAKEHFDWDLGFIGDNQWDEKLITVALIQSLWSKRKELTDEWFKKWSVVLHDEQHHIPADTFAGIISNFCARKRFGLSATIGKSPAGRRISELIYGPILWESKEYELKPEVQTIETGFTYNYVRTHKVGKKVIRNNYQSLVKALVESPYRNALIASKVLDNQTHANLIISRRLNHLKEIRAMCINNGFSSDRCWMLTGKESLERRMEIYELADKGNCAIFSTIADEALDIPRLDRLYMAFPAKNEETIKQQVGRLCRNHPDKDNAIIYDFKDSVDVLLNQYKTRLRKFYQRLELTVTPVKAGIKIPL
jgi:superfamily II DNA or RNA helicase